MEQKRGGRKEEKMIYDAEIRVPVPKEDKESFARACDTDNGKAMTVVARDLFSSYVKAIRKSQAWPSNFEPPNHNEVIKAAIKLLQGNFEGILN